jgi:hypothetical protein
VSEALAKLKKGDESGLDVSAFADSKEAPELFAQHVPDFRKDDVRAKLVSFAVAVEKGILLEAGRPHERSENKYLLSGLVGITLLESSDRVRKEAAKGLLQLFSPALLDKEAESIQKAAGRHSEWQVLLLWAVLPSTPSKDVLKRMRAVKRPPKLLARHGIDSILARHGDGAAEKRLLSTLEALSKSSGAEILSIVEALSYATTEKVKVALARQLRSEVMLRMAGGIDVPKRSVAACSLVQMMRDDEKFPVRGGRYSYKDADLDKIEKWCRKHLGVEFPEGLRKTPQTTRGT